MKSPPNRSSTTSPPLTIPQSLACGAIARISQILAMYPVDTIKVRIQVSHTATATPLTSLTRALQQGFLYRGAAFSLLGQVPYGMLTFGIYETLRTTLQTHAPTLPPWSNIILAAAIGDTIGSLWLTPSEVIKSKTQAGVFATPIQAARATASRGVPALYQGFAAALARDVPFRVIQLSLYERFRELYARRVGRAIVSVENLVLGAVAGSITAACTTPLDVVRTRMMSQAPGEVLYRNAIDCVVKTVRAEGVGGFFRGVVPRVLVIGPSSAVFFLAYEASKGFFRRRGVRVATSRVRRRMVWS